MTPEPEPTRKSIDTVHLEWLARALDIYTVNERISAEELLGKIGSLEYLAYPEGAVILAQGTPGKDLFILFRGTAEVVRRGSRLARLEPGDLFGEIGFLVGVPRTATVTAGPGCEVFRCESRGFEEILGRHPNLIESMRAIAKLRMERLNT